MTEGGRKTNPRVSLTPDQLNFSQSPSLQLNFVDYFLKSENGIMAVLNLADTKLMYETKCKSVIENMSKPNKSQTEEFFKKVVEVVKVKFPESNITVISNYHLEKYLEPIVTAIQLKAKDEVNTVTKYHMHISTVVSFIEERMRQKQVINPDALVDVETRILAGIISRFYPLFIKMKEAVIDKFSKKGSDTVISSDDIIMQLKKFILAIYVEIVSVSVTFSNILTNLLPNAAAQEKYRQKMALRKTHARHAVHWAARSVESVFLSYFIETELKIDTSKY